MKKLGLTIFACLLICLLAACSVDYSAYAGTYKLISLKGGTATLGDFAYCEIALDKKGDYVFEYKNSDGVVTEQGKFTIDEEGKAITFSESLLKGSGEILTMRMHVTFRIGDVEYIGLFLRTE